MPVGPLMVEHRLIERMIALIRKEIQKMRMHDTFDPEFVRAVVDFIITYADHLHHGKEEGILFRDLSRKPLSAEHRRIMDELIREHVFARENTGKILDLREKYLKDDKDSLIAIIEHMENLVQFYPRHIEKEDKHFFLPVMEYFSTEEQSAMLNEFYEFDRTFIHRRYREIVSTMEEINKD